MAGTTVKIAILADTGKFNKALGKSQSGLSKFGKAAGLGLAVAGAAAVKLGIDSVKAASDAQQSLGATETVFGKSADTIIKKSNDAAKAVGLSANQYRENANLIGSLFSNKGLKGNELARQTDLVIKKGADLSATFGGSASDAVEALSSAFKGEFDPIEKYGISIKQSTINTEAAALAHKKYGKDLDKLSTAQQNSIQRQATMNLINKQSAKSQGAFQKETGTLAHQQQVLGAQFENIKAKIGAVLLPILTKAFSYLNDTAIPAAEDLAASLKDNLADAVEFLKDVFDKIQPVLQKVIDFIKNNPETVKTFAIALGILTGAVLLVTGAVAAFNAILAINPITLIVVGLAALAAAFVYAYKKSETFRKIVDTGWSLLKKAFQVFWAIVKPIFKLWIDEIKAVAAIGKWLWNGIFQPVFKFIVGGVADVLRGFAKMLHALSHVPGFGWAGDLANKLDGAADNADHLANAIRDIPGRKEINIVTVYSHRGTPGNDIELSGRGGGGSGSGARRTTTTRRTSTSTKAPVINVNVEASGIVQTDEELGAKILGAINAAYQAGELAYS